MIKYMGAKSRLLDDGLGSAIASLAPQSSRFVDLFSGSGVVSWHVAERYDLKVVAVDTQAYAGCLARSVLGRTRLLDVSSMLHEAKLSFRAPRSTRTTHTDIQQEVRQNRLVSESYSSRGPITRCYGGHYYSALQALKLDHLVACAPRRSPEKDVYLACVLFAASKSAAAPGHTAQPFKPSSTSSASIRAAWNSDPFEYAFRAAEMLAARYARIVGETHTTDALSFASSSLMPGDLVFLDPPYSSVQYSRFYHVLETLVRGYDGPVTGRGRYPDQSARPISRFSYRSDAINAMADLLKSIVRFGAASIITVPGDNASNGLTSDRVLRIASQMFDVAYTRVSRQFSTLGGNHSARLPRQKATEAIIVLTPK